MNKRYQVFISSTFIDLKEERNEVMSALLELDCFPSGMELFPAADDSQWDVIKSIIDNCDYYILILAGRYGSTNKNGISYTELEYNYATEKGIPTIAFLHSDIGKLSVSKSEKSEKGKEKLDTFRQKAQQKLCKYWTTPQDLGSVVSRSLIQLIRNKPAIGWVRANNILSEKSASEILQLRNRIKELEIQDDFEPKGTENLKQGEDIFILRYTFNEKKINKSDDPFIDILNRGKNYKKNTDLITWNDIFYTLSPLMINESNEIELQEALGRLIIEKEILVLKEKFKESEFTNIRIDSEDFHTIIIQLRALKLILKSEKKRRVDDFNTYWKLSKYGDNLMTKIRALKK